MRMVDSNDWVLFPVVSWTFRSSLIPVPSGFRLPQNSLSLVLNVKGSVMIYSMKVLIRILLFSDLVQVVLTFR